MQKTLAEIAEIIGGKVVGDAEFVVTGLSGIKEAQEGHLTFVANPKYIPFIKKTKASAILTRPGVEAPGKSVIYTENPSLAFAQIASSLSKEKSFYFQGIHETAVIGKNVDIGADVAIGPYAIVEGDVRIGKGTVIFGGSYVSRRCRLGENCLVYPNVTICEETEIGDRVIIHSGTVIGSDGFGYEQVQGVHYKIPQMGIVVLEDDVEIGSNVTIDRARFDKTIIGRGTKIDNLVQIAHNVITGENCLFIAQVGISGSTKIGKGSIFAGQSGATGHLTIGEGCVVAAQTAVLKSLPPHTTVSGYPARPHDQAKKVNACVQRLPKHVKTIQELKQRVAELEKKVGQGG